MYRMYNWFTYMDLHERWKMATNSNGNVWVNIQLRICLPKVTWLAGKSTMNESMYFLCKTGCYWMFQPVIFVLGVYSLSWHMLVAGGYQLITLRSWSLWNDCWRMFVTSVEGSEGYQPTCRFLFVINEQDKATRGGEDRWNYTLEICVCIICISYVFYI